MSNESDDDIWARIKADGIASPVVKEPAGLEMENAQASRGQLKTQARSETADKLTWETTEIEAEETPSVKTRRRSKTTTTPNFLIGSIVVSLLWVLAIGALILENANAGGVDGSSLLANALMLILGPALALLAGFMSEGLVRSNREARYLINVARRLLEPEASGEQGVRSTAQAVRSEIGRLEEAIGTVAQRLSSIEAGLNNQTKALSLAGQEAHGGADKLIHSMESERERLNNLLVAMADLTSQAQTSTQMAAQGIEDRAARLAIVADDLVGKSTHASDAAANAALRLDQAASRAVSAIEQLDHAANRGEMALARAHDLMVLARLRADEAVGSVENTITSLADAAANASSLSQNVASTIGAQNETTRAAGLAHLEEVRAAAIMNATELTAALRAEAQAAHIAGEETLAALKASADAMRFAAAEARQQASEQVSDNQRRLDLVRQSAFEIGKDADGFMEKRLSDAKVLIEKSAVLLDDTGDKIQDRFTRLAAACSDQARAVEDLLDGLDRRLSDLPQEAQARAQAIESALSQTLERLTLAGRKAAEETAALDGAFQNRLRDSYSALGEVVQRLGGLSGVLPASPLSAQPLAPPPMASPPTIQTVPNQAPLPSQLQPENGMLQPPQQTPPAGTPIVPPVPPSLDVNAPIKIPTSSGTPFASKTPAPSAPNPTPTPPLLPQPVAAPTKSGLKITSPIPVDDDPFADLNISPAPPANTPEAGNWSWKQVLSTLDAKGEQQQANKISQLVTELSLDTSMDDAVLDRLRALASRSRDQARRGTRELVGEHVRAMRRKLASDPDLRASLVRFVESRREAAARGRLAGHEARVYLVTDAALEA